MCNGVKLYIETQKILVFDLIIKIKKCKNVPYAYKANKIYAGIVTNNTSNN
jgi:hypothetical protein